MNIRARVIFILLLSGGYFACGPSVHYTTANLHSHNDYLNDLPFSRAYHNQYGSIEADVFPVNGVLCVAHSKRDIQPKRTLKSLYLDPLLHELADNGSHVRLLVDIKENYALSLQLLVREVQPLLPFLSGGAGNGALTIIISGTRPPPAEYKNYPPYIFFDDDLKFHHSAEEWGRVGLVSLSFEKLSGWKGTDRLPAKDKALLKHTVDSVHNAGKPIRFWAAPDNETSWKMQMKLGVDLIGTDKIDGLARFISR